MEEVAADQAHLVRALEGRDRVAQRAAIVGEHRSREVEVTADLPGKVGEEGLRLIAPAAGLGRALRIEPAVPRVDEAGPGSGLRRRGLAQRRVGALLGEEDPGQAFKEGRIGDARGDDQMGEEGAEGEVEVEVDPGEPAEVSEGILPASRLRSELFAQGVQGVDADPQRRLGVAVGEEQRDPGGGDPSPGQGRVGELQELAEERCAALLSAGDVLTLGELDGAGEGQLRGPLPGFLAEELDARAEVVDRGLVGARQLRPTPRAEVELGELVALVAGRESGPAGVDVVDRGEEERVVGPRLAGGRQEVTADAEAQPREHPLGDADVDRPPDPLVGEAEIAAAVTEEEAAAERRQEHPRGLLGGLLGDRGDGRDGEARAEAGGDPQAIEHRLGHLREGGGRELSLAAVDDRLELCAGPTPTPAQVIEGEGAAADEVAQEVVEVERRSAGRVVERPGQLSDLLGRGREGVADEGQDLVAGERIEGQGLELGMPLRASGGLGRPLGPLQKVVASGEHPAELGDEEVVCALRIVVLAGARDDEDVMAVGVAEQALEELQRRSVRRLQIVDEEDQRRVDAGEGLEEALDRDLEPVLRGVGPLARGRAQLREVRAQAREHVDDRGERGAEVFADPRDLAP